MKEVSVLPVAASQVLPLRAKVLRPHHPLIDCVFESDHVALAGHFGASNDSGEILSVGTIYPEAFPAAKRDLLIGENADTEFWRLRGMATDEAVRGEGLGTQILLSCIGHARLKRSAKRALIWAHARTGAMKFYRRHGFRAVGSEYDLPGIGPHFLIILDL